MSKSIGEILNMDCGEARYEYLKTIKFSDNQIGEQRYLLQGFTAGWYQGCLKSTLIYTRLLYHRTLLAFIAGLLLGSGCVASLWLACK